MLENRTISVNMETDALVAG